MQNSNSPVNLIANFEDLLRIVESHKSQGKIIVTTNGVFDLLHIGHIQHLISSKSFGDILVVLINSDNSTKRIKGAGRPICGELERAGVLCELRSVDYLYIFSDDTPVNVLATIKPHIHTKGGDYTIEDLPETKIIESYKGDMKVLSLYEGKSTSKIIELIVRIGSKP